MQRKWQHAETGQLCIQISHFFQKAGSRHQSHKNQIFEKYKSLTAAWAIFTMQCALHLLLSVCSPLHYWLSAWRLRQFYIKQPQSSDLVETVTSRPRLHQKIRDHDRDRKVRDRDSKFVSFVENFKNKWHHRIQAETFFDFWRFSFLFWVFLICRYRRPKLVEFQKLY